MTPADWKLLRYCPTPVLLVKTATPWAGGVILAAIDVGNTDSEHRSLHNAIIDHGFDIASLAKAQLHVISAHPSPMLSAADPTFSSKGNHRGALSRTMQGIPGRVRRGRQAPAYQGRPGRCADPHMAHQLHAAVTIIGTVARTGISGR